VAQLPDVPLAGAAVDAVAKMSIPIVKGRTFTEHDNESSTPAMVVSQSFARRYFSNGDAIGRRARLNEQGALSCCASPAPVDGVWREIVGVVGDITQANLDEPPSVTMYRPYLQIVEHDMYFVTRVRSGVDGPRTAAAIQRELRAIDTTKAWWPIRTMERVIDESESIRLRRFVLILLGLFASLALVLAGVGLYGVMAYFVAERRREIGIRVALGATRAAILEQVLLEAMRLVLAGLLLGCLAAQALTRTVSSMLFGITATDPLTFLTVATALGAVALLASYLPARRAAQLDPVVAMSDS
jgi:putative ABC transport system permease protein